LKAIVNVKNWKVEANIGRKVNLQPIIHYRKDNIGIS